MIPSTDNQLCVGHCSSHNLERFNHELQAFVGSPFSESEDPVLGITTPGEIRILGPTCQNAVGTHVNIIVPIFFMENLAVSRHQDGNRIREQQHSGRDSARGPIQTRVSHAGVFQVHRVHQMVQGNVSVAAAQACQQGSEKSQESVDWIAAKRTEKQIEPNYIGLQLTDCLKQSNRTGGIVERPAALHGEAVQFGLRGRHLIGQNGKAQKRIAAQFFRNMQAVLAQSPLAGRKGGHQTNFHLFFGLCRCALDGNCGEDVAVEKDMAHGKAGSPENSACGSGILLKNASLTLIVASSTGRGSMTVMWPLRRLKVR
ncbi:MAG: hypothetical protein JWQ87_1085 [Candidatus Sulfotelmatobacter sp.]|nr:hypothetical protein [Candidatus Sulfotelmatobacter sp.]